MSDVVYVSSDGSLPVEDVYAEGCTVIVLPSGKAILREQEELFYQDSKPHPGDEVLIIGGGDCMFYVGVFTKEGKFCSYGTPINLPNKYWWKVIG
jgi:hypothetical protein